MTETRPPAGSHAVVIGGSMSGLWAARVLADHFAQVTVIERDHLPDEPLPRRGVPQARHVHVLLAQGWRILEDLFPGLPAELAAQGVPIFDWGAAVDVLYPLGWGQRHLSGLILGALSRDRLEWNIRRRLRLLPNVRFLERHDVAGFLASGDQVVGVRLRVRGDEGVLPADGAPGEESLRADLVVDASGRDSRTPDWLATLGYDKPDETRINSFLGYATRWYRRPPEFAADWQALLVSARPPRIPRSGGIYSIENDQWMVTLAGAARDYPPTDEEGFTAFARSLATPRLADALRDAEPISPIYGYRRTENRWRRFERLRRWPDRLVVVGDAVCAFNPVYGQGMTVGALDALTLADTLAAHRRRHPAGDLTVFGLTFQKALAATLRTPWQLATGVDFRYPTTEGGRPSRATRLSQRYMDRVLDLAGQDVLVNRTLASVVHLVAPPRTLLQPRIAAKVLAYSLSARTHKGS